MLQSLSKQPPKTQPDGPHRRAARLPFGYSVEFRYSAASGIAAAWTPHPPRIESRRAQRRFFAAYTAERNAFLRH